VATYTIRIVNGQPPIIEKIEAESLDEAIRIFKEREAKNRFNVWVRSREDIADSCDVTLHPYD
jgi:hypothetical protein